MRAQFAHLPEVEDARKRNKVAFIENSLRRSGVPASFRSKRLADIGNAPLKAAMQSFVDQWAKVKSKGWGLYLWGNVGRGKTHAATALCNELIEKHFVEVMFLNASDLANRLRDVVGERNTDDEELVNEMKKAELLVLDDLGVERFGNWLNEQFYIVVNHRYENNLPTVVTSNLPLDSLGEIMRPQIASRLEERCEIFKFGGKNWREELRPNFIKKQAL